MACGILVLLIAAIAASTNGYSSNGYYPDGKDSYSYTPKVVKSTAYASSSSYHAGYAGHKLITGHAYRFKVGRIFNRFHRLGVELIGRGIKYNGFYYGRLCSATQLYGALNSCYESYGNIRDCFPGLIKQGLIGRRHIYHKYGHGFGLGVTFVKRGIVYGRSFYKFGCRRPKFIRYMTSCYNKFHHASTCVSVLRKRHLIRTPHSYHGHIHLAGYTRFRRFKIRHGRFRYGGRYYKLSCNKRRFYSYWNRCYGRYHSVGRCFGYLRRKHLFSYYNAGYSSVATNAYGAGYSSGITFDYGYYRSHHGFSIRNNRFTYGGIGYKLMCARSRFYRLWGQCYNRYHSVGSCFGRLRRQHLFYKYGGAGYSSVAINAYGPGYSSGITFDYGYYRSHHGFSIRNNRFTYGGIGYKLMCARSRFYRLWGQCYNRYHSVGSCFGRLRRQHLFYRYDGDDYFQVGGNAYGVDYSPEPIFDRSYYSSHHGFRIRHQRFSYNGIAYRLKCSRSRFYRLWGQCYHRYHSVGTCFGRLRSHHLFYRYLGDHQAILNKHLYLHKKIADNHVRRIHNVAKSHVAKISHVSNKHVRNIQFQANKHVSRIANEARSHMNRFKQLVDYHIRRLHKHTKYHLSAAEHQHKKHLNERQYQNNKHELNVRRLHKKHEYNLKKHGYAYGHSFSYGGKGHAYRFKVGRIFNRFHRLGVELIGRGIKYNGFYYGRLCSATQLYGALNSCYEDYGDISNCFPGLIKQGLIGRRHIYHKYGHGFGLGVTFVKRGIVYGRSFYKYGCRRSKFIRYMTSCYNKFHHASTCVSVLRKRHLIATPHSYHGHIHLAGYTRFRRFAIHGGRFRYGGRYYKLSCSKKRFYSYWNRCYGRYHSVGRCFGYLKKKNLFSYYNGYSSGVVYNTYGPGYSNGITFDYGYYKSHHGFTIRNNKFSYGGIGYQLMCGRSRFYRLWGECYNQYNSVSSCFGRLRRQHLFYRYGGGYDGEDGYVAVVKEKVY
ncbi:uncharacterized protein LOC127738467 isoform X2 [Mytilus californianus]|uniref:uncharacterized protein LOC127738467 isoform X2 n=1 Tax=Mytilus californianus TaxID=6549 RepID=UPI0022455C6E|nr:uncharacterized protein LOC127738467 isoform X2 [Mytilus californianus]